MKEKDGQNIKIPISTVAREGGGHAYPSPSSHATFSLASHFPRERASESPVMCRFPQKESLLAGFLQYDHTNT